ncbi:MAG: hypothetical protein HY301_02745 [Verrucomicrobia bacterium]|nr:hypothetical protein [Verrucomicrobiota bacterium]
MTPYFNTPEKLAALAVEQSSWAGTPWHRNAALKGVGADCVQWIGAGLVNVGHLPHFTPPRYNVDGGHHESDSALVTWLAQQGKFFARVDLAEASVGGCVNCGAAPNPPRLYQCEPGDVLCFCLHTGRIEWHAGWFRGEGKVLHTLEGHSIVEQSLGDSTYNRRLKAVFRPVACPLPLTALPLP